MSLIWKVVISLSMVGLLWTGGKFLIEFYDYALFSEFAQAEVEKWEVKQLSPNKFAVEATYLFYPEKGGPVKAKYRFRKPYYPNQFAAEEHLKLWQQHEWGVWYQRKEPHFSALQRLFPVK